MNKTLDTSTSKVVFIEMLGILGFTEKARHCSAKSGPQG